MSHLSFASRKRFSLSLNKELIFDELNLADSTLQIYSGLYLWEQYILGELLSHYIPLFVHVNSLDILQLMR